MALTLLRLETPDDRTALAVFADADGSETVFRFRLDGHGDVQIAHAEEAFTDAYLAVPGPDVPQAHEFVRLVTALLQVRARPLPSGEELAREWDAVGEELEQDWSR